MGRTLNRWWQGREERIAIDVQTSRLIVASGAMQPSSQPHVCIIPLGDEGPTTKSPASVEHVSDLLRSHLVATDFCYAQLGVSLPSHTTFIAQHPDLFRRPFSDFARVQDWISQSLSLKQEEHRVAILPHAVGDLYERCVVAAAKRPVVEFWEQIAEALGCDLVLVAPRACALHRYGQDDGKEDKRKTSLCLDMTEHPPYAHRFDSGAFLGSFQISDLMSLQGLVQREFCDLRPRHAVGLDDDDLSVWCLLHEGQSISEVSRSLGLGSWHVGQIQIKESKDETIAARGILRMLEDLYRED